LPPAAFLLEKVRLLLRERSGHEACAAVIQLQTIRDKHPAPERSSWSDIHVAAAVAEGLVAIDGGRTNEGLRHLTGAYDDLLAAGNLYGALRVGLELSNAHFVAKEGGQSKAFEILTQVLAWAAKAKTVSFFRERIKSRLDRGRHSRASKQTGGGDRCRSVSRKSRT
jgi:hypothetical protein